MLLTAKEKAKIIQNEQEDNEFIKQLDKYYEKKLNTSDIIKVGKTSNALSISGADNSLDVIINQSTVSKCVSPPSQKERHGHELSKDIMKQLPQQLRNPIMIFNSPERNSLVVITALKDNQNRGIMVAVALNQNKGWVSINRIASIYGRNNFNNYIKNQIEKGNLLACNTEKANEMLRSIGLQLPKENTFIGFNDSIAYSMKSVKYPKKEKHLRSSEKMVEKKENTVIKDFANVNMETDFTDFKAHIADFDRNQRISLDDFKKANQLFNVSENTLNSEISVKSQETTDISKNTVQEEVEQESTDISKSKFPNFEEVIQNVLNHFSIAKTNENAIKAFENGDIAEYLSEKGYNIDDSLISALHKAASENDLYSQNILGVCYFTGMNVSVDEEKAISYFEMAAKENFPSAQRNLAIVLESQNSPDKNKIIDLYTKSANEGDIYAQNNLGVCYISGDGVNQNARKAVYYFEKAVKGGDDYAMVNLADCYSFGNGVRKNDSKAFDLYKQAAEENNVDGIRKTGDCLYNGIGIEPNFTEALKFYKLAVENGDTLSQKMVDEIEDKLSNNNNEVGISAKNTENSQENSEKNTTDGEKDEENKHQPLSQDMDR